jgi:uncharacterized protein (DUF2267 family)
MQQTLQQAIHLVSHETGLDGDASLTALQTVAEAIVRRVTPTEANDFISQLPSALHEPLLDLPAGPDRNVTLESVRSSLAARLSLDAAEVASLIPRIGAAIGQLVSPGESRDVLAQLPDELHQLLRPAAGASGSA